MVIEDAALLNRRVTLMTPAALFSRRLQLPRGFYDLQDKVRDGLENEFWANFDDCVDRSKLPTWKKRRSNFFAFPAEKMNCEQIGIELSKEILNDKLIKLIISYLKKSAALYSVVGAVYENMESDNYLGRFVVNLDEIVVEESLADTWSNQVDFTKL